MPFSSSALSSLAHPLLEGTFDFQLFVAHSVTHVARFGEAGDRLEPQRTSEFAAG